MRSKSRLLNNVYLHPKLEAGEGTLLEEIGVTGPYRIWWTDEKVCGDALSAPTNEEPFDDPLNSQRLEEYLDAEKGKAFLTSLSPRHARSSKFTRKYPKIAIMRVWSL